MMVRPSKRKTRSSSSTPTLPENKRTTRNKRSRPIEGSVTNISESVPESHKEFQFKPQSDDIFSKILASKNKSVDINGNYKVCCHSPASRNVVQTLHHHSIGGIGHRQLKKTVFSPVLDLVQNLQLYRTASPFDRRCTAMEWHPTNPSIIATGSKGGDIILWNINNVNNDLFIPGQGPGGSISAIKFHPTIPTKIYTSSIDGKVSLQDFSGKQSQVYLDTMSWQSWFCSLDTSIRRSQLVAGDTTGHVNLLSMDGKKVFCERLHKQKVCHTEFSPREDWLLITASLDKTLKVWDLRMIKDRTSCLKAIEHDKPLNSAYFSLTDGCRVLATDQHQDLLIYDTVTWRLEKQIQHPHRFFQHITPIKAHWHPLHDLIVVGRYPDPKFPSYTEDEKRTIDIISPESGDVVAQLSDPAAPGIVSLNKFNPQGDMLASTMGVNMLLWKQKEELEERQRLLMESMKQSGVQPQGSRSNQRRPPKQKKEKNTKLLTDTKMTVKKKNLK